MNLLTFPVTCSRCGGEGVGTLRTASMEWLPGAWLEHTNRRVCNEILWSKSRRSENRPPPKTDAA